MIEDDANNLLIANKLLQAHGIHQVATALSGAAGIQRAEMIPHPDLILLDLQLPGEDGYTVLRAIRRLRCLGQTRVVAVTANVFPQDQVQAREAGFDGFIGKPLDFDRFPAQIQAILAGESIWSV